MFSGRSNDHRLGLASQPILSPINKVIQHQLCLSVNNFAGCRNIVENRSLCLGAIVLSVIIFLLFNTIGIQIASVAKQRIQNKSFLNGLPHGVLIKVTLANLGTSTKELHGLFFRSCCECKVADIPGISDGACCLDQLILAIFHLIVNRIQVSSFFQ